MVRTPHSRQKSFLGIVGILERIFIIVDNHIFSLLQISLIVGFVIPIWIFFIQAYIDFRKHGAIEQMRFWVLLSIVVGQKFTGVVRIVFIDHGSGIGTDG